VTATSHHHPTLGCADNDNDNDDNDDDSTSFLDGDLIDFEGKKFHFLNSDNDK
jgi:hypothetical protein